MIKEMVCNSPQALLDLHLAKKKLNCTHHPYLKQYVVKSFGEMYRLDDSWEWEWPHVYLPFSHICEWHGIRISGMIDKFV